ncbi:MULTISPECIES: ABC transporter ATP-binding protein [Micromonospora]|uniref:ABC transporter n=1 Tax=Micromonospora maris TaxID=1003110 RepID=A0A9X0HZW3_9ACTN|nr:MULTISPECIES: ABC transporter ATP-binding protein [Micromonospora]AEB44721.1 ABC transporter related protein [Micromonospora maris AB-18-032]KUJ44205.1 ABC transporter [Micromonospora maris]RUL90135.1 ABC transporter ATP-binding protein [Verrucosispora sp. FIM060022]
MRADETTASSAAVTTQDLTRVYGSGAGAVRALDGVSASFARGRFTAVMGPSGSGKSTFLHCLAGLDRPTSGAVVVAGQQLARLNRTALAKLRRERMGFVFQAFNLLPVLTAEENITMIAHLARRRVDRAWMAQLVARLGLADRLDHRPAQLSGGQQQRVAIARALLTRPDVVFADEPTGNLDSRSGTEVLRFLREAVETENASIVMVTHDPTAAAYADEVLFLADGRIVDTLAEPTVDEVLARLRRISEPS